MDAVATNRTFLFDHIQRALREGRYLPGEWIDPVALAREFNTSVMPVQHALHQLAGAGLIVMHPRGDFHVPMLFEPNLEERYHWMKSLLLEAIDRGGTAPPAAELPAVPDPQNTPNAAWRLFDAIANATASAHLNTAIKRTNDQLAPVRHAKQALLDDAHDEMATLYEHWAARDLASLKAGVRTYHRRRIAMVPQIVLHLGKKAASAR
ncbi:hypothetical protein BEN78_04485 [Xanthomonas citri pv. mangiferaeindicae]|nr:hypothetical protein BEN78_04485 [Xanthomonas citri pv. mangiferaeindicae]